MYIYDEITDKTAQELAKNLADGMEIRINSAGGNIFSAIAMFNLLKNKNAKIIVDGLAASAATLICASGYVTAAASSLFMIHNPAVILFDFYTAEELDKLKNQLELIKDSILDIYSTKLKLSREEISNLMDAETWLTADEALQIGLIDKIDESLEVQNMADSGKELMAKYKNSVLIEERARVAGLNALKNDNPAVNSIINKAIEDGDTVEKIKGYVDAINNAPIQPAFKNMIEDNLNSGAENVTGSIPEDKEAAKVDLLAKFLNEAMGGVK